jgi:Nitrile hydratase beta subunit
MGRDPDKAPYRVLLDTLCREHEPATALPELERKRDPWESSMQATCECLSWRGALDNLERRHAEDALGESVYQDFPVHSRSVVVTAHALMDRGVISPEELQDRMDRIRERFTRQ